MCFVPSLWIISFEERCGQARVGYVAPDTLPDALYKGGADLKTKIAEEEATLAKYQSKIKTEADFISKIGHDSIPWIKEIETLDFGKAYNQMKKYEANKDIVLARKAKVTYSIMNPLLNNAKQEVTRTFAFSPDNKRVLAVIE